MRLSAAAGSGVKRIFQEKILGSSISRLELDKLNCLLRPEDTVTVNRLSRLGRNTDHVIQLLADFSKKYVWFVSLDLGIDRSTSAGSMVVTVFAALTSSIGRAMGSGARLALS
ncbi:recombinase family protein [Hymenobacter sediminis]|uniref:recombinase family protein n=1 Tax=Hymenobacter sediminis TaxID=2218621 RepID=UPI00139057E1|nr:recombinase family protein [Hymenobacter sediminis]